MQPSVQKQTPPAESRRSFGNKFIDVCYAKTKREPCVEDHKAHHQFKDAMF